jgi:hypothetical protein
MADCLFLREWEWRRSQAAEAIPRWRNFKGVSLFAPTLQMRPSSGGFNRVGCGDVQEIDFLIFCEINDFSVFLPFFEEVS